MWMTLVTYMHKLLPAHLSQRLAMPTLPVHKASHYSYPIPAAQAPTPTSVIFQGVKPLSSLTSQTDPIMVTQRVSLLSTFANLEMPPPFLSDLHRLYTSEAYPGFQAQFSGHHFQEVFPDYIPTHPQQKWFPLL